MKKLSFIFVLLAFLLPGKVHGAAEDHIVTRVRVDCAHQDVQLFRNYTDTEKVETILNFLRLCKFAGLPESAPPARPDSRSVFTVSLAGGGQRVYELLDGQYFSKDGSPWELVEPPASILSLLQTLPGDL